MKYFLFSLLFFVHCFSLTSDDLRVLYNSLDPSSISELFAFYKLYPETKEGQNALKKAWALMQLHRPLQDLETSEEPLQLPPLDIHSIIGIVNRSPHQNLANLSDKQLLMIEKISSHLSNRSLPGFRAVKIQELFDLASDQIDLGRAVLLYEFGEDLSKIRHYEASLDLMALQILARLPQGASDMEKVRAINQFIFHEMQFRFPPHSLWPKNVDTYTLLPAILDSRQGVCLGVSILYLCLAQRLNLPLEIITPPGHIYLRYVQDGKETNIETTARGIHIPSKSYMGMQTRSLEKRSLKEVVGLSFMNQAANAWHKFDYAAAIAFYEKAKPYLQSDYLLKFFLGLNYLFIGETKKGEALLKEIQKVTPEEAILKDTIIEDYFNQKVDVDGLKAVFLNVDEKRSSIMAKQEKIKAILKKFPKFREGLFHLGITYLQLGRSKEGLEIFSKYHALDPNNPVIEYYLTILCMERYDYPKAWDHLRYTRALLEAKNHKPDALRELEHSLRTHLRENI